MTLKKLPVPLKTPMNMNQKVKLILVVAGVFVVATSIWFIFSRARAIRLFESAAVIHARDGRGNVKYWEYDLAGIGCDSNVKFSASSHAKGAWVNYGDGSSIEVYRYRDYIFIDQVKIDAQSCYLFVEVKGLGGGVIPTRELIVFNVKSRKIEAIVKL